MWSYEFLGQISKQMLNDISNGSLFGPRDSLGPQGAKSLHWQIFWSLGGLFSNTSLLPAVYHYNKILVFDFQKLTSPETIQSWGQRSSLFLSYSCNIPVIAKKIRVVTHQLSYISSSVFLMHKSCFLHLGAFRIQTTSNELRWNKMSY